MQGLEDIYIEHREAGFLPVSVLIHDALGATPDIDDAALWADGLGLTYPVLADVDAEFYPVWDPEEVLPVTYIIDRDGVVRWAEAGGTGQLEDIDEFVVDLLDENPS